MSPLLIDIATAPRMPWRNGGGETIELAIAPAGASLEDFAWRISSARVAMPGAFSSFAGIDRSLSILDGDGLGLVAGDGPAFMLAADSQPWRFAGEEAVHAELLKGPVTDFNVMTRRDTWRYVLERHDLSDPQRLAHSTDVLFIFCHTGLLDCCLGSDEPVRLGAGQGLLLKENTQPITLHPLFKTEVYLAHLHRLG